MCISHFAPKLFLDPKIPIMVTFIAIHVHPVKRSYNYVRNSDTYEVFNGHLSIRVLF